MIHKTRLAEAEMNTVRPKVVLLQLPPVTRAYITLSFLTTAGCALEVIPKYRAKIASECQINHPCVNAQCHALLLMPIAAAGHLTFQHILQCKADIPERGSMALVDNLHVLWKPRLVS